MGEAKWGLDILFGRTEGMEVIGPPMRWVVDGNWKVAAGNFAGDPVHLFTTHGFRTALQLEDRTQNGRRTFDLTTDRGHALSFIGSDQDVHLCLPEELWPEMERRLTRDQLDMVKPLITVVGNVFPNMSILNSGNRTPGQWGGEHANSFLTVRLWQPRGADGTEVWSWFFVDRNAPDWWKEASRESYLRTFGMGGIFEQDDTENWAEITRALRGPIARRLWLQYKLGLGSGGTPERPVPQLQNLEKSSIGEHNERAFYGRWQELMVQP